MLKLVGAMLIVLATTLIGFRVAGAYRDRPRQLRSLIRALTHLQAEVEYQTTPLPVALQNVAARGSPPCSTMFQRVSDHLIKDGMTVSEAFRVSLVRLVGESALQSADCEAIQSVADSLSTMDVTHLQTQFQMALEALRQAESGAREHGLKNARLWQYLGVLTGVILVILLY
ncbi:stage III sporulation protein SpoIIIAB [Alicyclobacillus dauci]|uniref:Stage III sporulation protein SpoIIIAB n=1 Tax=Alicyclobacillus dauci TaxID=1475485 RepID=A0ABY6ZA08_9BACL|nr:stage III sporulation protein SpoIIIAB [Alicyclobacillus dauci]WAH38996.1 stage III sporulation protein SpoIIIAB [Alicyclobacillus dauci]